MNKEIIKITEADLKNIIKKSVCKIINEGRNSNDVLNKVWISYGTNQYDYSKTRDIDFDDPMAIFLNKPKGGLWASPIDSMLGWSDFVAREDFETDSLSKHFIFKLSPSANIYTINDVADMKPILSLNRRTNSYMLNFKKLKDNKYDGVYVTKDAVTKLRYNDVYIGYDLQSWDVESICIWNDNIIIPLQENDFRRSLINKDMTNKRQKKYDDSVMRGEEEFSDWSNRKKDTYKELNNYRNLNTYPDVRALFRGEHPGILAQGNDDDDNTEAAKGYNGTKISGMNSLGKMK